MRTVIHFVLLLGILSLSLVSLTGCGEKRLHVVTLSGTPGEEAPVEPINSGHESSMPAHTEVASADGDTDSLPPFPNGSDIATQSGSSTMNGSPRDHVEPFPFTAPAAFQNDLSSPQVEMEPISESVQVAKAEPSDMLRQQVDKMKEEELAAVAAGLKDVFFQFDSWSLTAEAKQTLEHTLGWFQQDPSSHLIIEGHADQRGTQAYNMVLAKKRAAAVQGYLSQLGVSPSRLAVISYGKDKPFCQDATEVCYQLNRRGHFLVQATLHP